MTEEQQIIEIVKECVRRLNINGAVRKETIIHEAIMKAKNISSKTLVIKSVCSCKRGNAWTWDEVRGINICSYCGKDEQTVL